MGEASEDSGQSAPASPSPADECRQAPTGTSPISGEEKDSCPDSDRSAIPRAMREIIFDTETTGFEPSEGHRIVEIACLEPVSYTHLTLPTILRV